LQPFLRLGKLNSRSLCRGPRGRSSGKDRFTDYQPYFTQRMWDFFADHLLGDRQTGADILEKNNTHR